ncbi:MAG: 16S rRNA (cytosine(967)-C(5))-methyltransferase RsmB [Desulfurispora sp.]|uniref:16S rRNA (cytosine(967)-C(5))-methyltransferase RsmB n=1 Tax=Desulfurispora sp. TaxID=3014275 RepID=UPI00404B0960
MTEPSARRLSARDAALQVLVDVEIRQAYAGLALHKVLAAGGMNKKDRALATQLVYGVLRTRNALDWMLGQFVSRPLDELEAVVRNGMRLAVYQLCYLERIPAPAAVHEAVEQMRRFRQYGAVKFVNAVLRRFLREKENIVWPAPESDPVQYLSVRYSHPVWLVRRWLKEWGRAVTEEMLQANNQPAPLTCRVNTLRISREQILAWFDEQGLKARAGLLAPEAVRLEDLDSVENLPPFQSGWLTVQDESSMLAAHVLAPRPDEKVLDVAAAPGGKSTHLAQLMLNRGEVVACDIHPHKLGLIEENCRRLGATIVRPVHMDATALPGEWRDKFQRVLVDAPCSGLGVLGRRPDARWRKQPELITQLAELQARILSSAARCVQPGGVLVYSTCTLTREENQAQVAEFLARHPHFQRLDLSEELRFLPRQVFNNAGEIELLPHMFQTDGFFIAALRRNEVD